MSKTKKSLISFLLAFCLLTSFPLASNLLLPATNSFGIIEVQAAAKPKLNKTKLVLIKGQTYTLKVQNNKKAVKWASSKTAIATVDSKGKVTAKKKGNAVISAKVGGKTYKCNLTVETPSISKTSLKLTVYATAKLTVKGTQQNVTWKSSSTKIATVDSNGKVTAKAIGTAKIIATVGDNKKFTCNVTVTRASKEDAFDKLEEIIEQYGYFDKDGDKSIEKTEYSSNNEYNINIYILNDKLWLVYNTYFSDGGYAYTEVQLSKNSDIANVYFECYYLNNESSEPDEAGYASFNAKTWNSHTITFDLVDTYSNADYFYSVQNYASAALKSLVYDSKELLKEYGMSINDLGFYAYNQE